MKNYAWCLKTLLLFTIGIGLSSEGIAQRKTGRSTNIDVYMGSAIKKAGAKKMEQFLVANKSGFVTHTYHLGEDIYSMYDTTLQPVSTVKFDRMQSNNDLVYKGFIQLHEKAILLTGKALNYDKANAVYLAEFDAEELQLKETREVTRVDGNGFYANFHQAHLGYSVSEDGSKFVVYFKKIKQGYKSEDFVQRFRFMVFDADLKKLWEQDVEFESEDGDYLLGGSNWEKEAGSNCIGIANNGTVYCWGRTDKGDGYENDARYHVKLSKISVDGHEMIPLQGDQEKKIRDWNLQGTDAGMIMASNYMEWENTTKSPLEKSDGLAFASWTGATKQPPILKFHEFDEEYMTLNQSKNIIKRVSRDAKGPAGAFEDNFEINGFQKIDADNYLILGESRHDSTKFNAHLEIDITTYTRRDAHFFSVNMRDGNLNWSTRIPKFQKNKTAVGLGYVCKVVGRKMYVLFNDHFDNITKEWNVLSGPNKFSQMDNPVVLMTIDMDNPQTKVKREKLWKTEQTKSYFEPANFFSQYNLNEGLLYLDDEVGKERFVKLIFR